MLTFRVGDPDRPRGHALLFFRDADDPDIAWATYLVVAPIQMDLGKYIPAAFATQLAVDTVEQRLAKRVFLNSEGMSVILGAPHLCAESLWNRCRQIVEAFNDLLHHLHDSSMLQQRFLANAAHQLRTPLAGLQMHLELMLRRDLQPEVRSELQRMHGATIRAGRRCVPSTSRAAR